MEDLERKENLKSTKKAHPKETTNIISTLFFCWTLPFFFKGLKKDISEDDLYQTLQQHESKQLGDRLEKEWNVDLKRYQRPSLWRILFRIFGKEYAVCGLFMFIQELIVKMAQPLLIGNFLNYFNANEPAIETTIQQAYIYGALLILTTFINMLITHQNMLGMLNLGMRIRVACCSLIYRKSLRLSKNALCETTIGQMVNLITNDVRRFDMLTSQTFHAFLAPIETAVILYLLCTTVHPAAMSGVAILIAFVPLQLYLGRKMAQFRRKTALRTDNRVRLMNEIITGIQVIKMYTWEKPFIALIEKARRLEMKEIKGASYLRAINLSFSNFLSRSSIYVCILTYVLLGNRLEAQYVYVLSAFYNLFRMTITVWLPNGITGIAETNISIKRIENFLHNDEIKIDKSTINPKATIGISMEDVSVKWISTNSDYTLNQINFNIAENQLIAIVGPVGSGKTTLLHVILKELPILTGQMIIEGRISYASQESWLFGGSIKQNILFGEQMDRKKYHEIIKVCALERDLSLLPYGDRTIIGERGVMLSGGQKARINLARAIYKDADIYLLDDPLSAVDTHVGKQLFDDCIVGYLKYKCVILVTHQLQYLKTVDRIYLLENGRITASGSCAELQNNSGNFLKLLQNELNEENEETDRESLQSSMIKRLSDKGDLPQEIKEHKSTGNVSGEVYKKYLKAGGGYLTSSIIIVLYILTQTVSSGTDYFLTFWVNLEQERFEQIVRNNITINDTTTIETEIENRIFTPEICIYIYTILLISVILLTLIRSLGIFKFCIKAAKTLHNIMFTKIVFTPMRFFHTNPSGRILNRFSKDIGAIDEALPGSIVDTVALGLMVVSISAVIAVVNPWILIPTVIIFGIFYIYKTIYLATSRDLKRLDGTTRSPVFTHLAASVQGLTTIRAFHAQDILTNEFDHHQDLHTSAHYMFIACARTFGFWLDLNCVIYTGLVTFSFLFIGKQTYAGNVGLAITQSITLIGSLQWALRNWSDVENQMTSVERVIEYTEIQPEIDEAITKPSEFWPELGTIEFRNVSLRYSLDNPIVLKNLSFKINDCEKIGIVGRTGAGKSSLISALFRLTPHITGDIIIDKINTNQISLKELRSKISIIPQEPVLFSGTLRKNLDPFDEYGDDTLWSALEDVELKQFIFDLPSGLQSTIAEGGANFSVGQRQLLCLARAVIRSNKILILDEATANVDPQTDELIQKTIRNKFRKCTVLTIAHRLHTVMDSDRILVINVGEVAEFDCPNNLLKNEKSLFYSLVQQTGRSMADNLMRLAKESFKSKFQD